MFQVWSEEPYVAEVGIIEFDLDICKIVLTRQSSIPGVLWPSVDYGDWCIDVILRVIPGSSMTIVAMFDYLHRYLSSWSLQVVTGRRNSQLLSLPERREFDRSWSTALGA